LTDNPRTRQVIGLAMNVHRAFGPALLESAYEEFLCIELDDAGIPFVRQITISAVHKGRKATIAYRADIPVGDGPFLEIKSVGQLAKIHDAQMSIYRRLSGRRVGLLLNFNTVLLKDGLKRFINSPTP
jgi:GxxExxY protein